jgi:hypothetical protein
MSYRKLNCKKCNNKETRVCMGYDYDYSTVVIPNLNISTVGIGQYYFYSCTVCGEKTVVKFDSDNNVIQESIDV